MKYILDVAKWRCGGGFSKPGPSGVGVGATALLNIQGYMCCLGQFEKQSGADENDLKDVDDPASLGHIFDKALAYVEENTDGDTEIKNSDLSHLAMDINDSADTTPLQKISLLRKLFKKHGHTIQVKNINMLKGKSSNAS